MGTAQGYKALKKKPLKNISVQLKILCIYCKFDAVFDVTYSISQSRVFKAILLQ
jgi:hypothetical protein